MEPNENIDNEFQELEQHYEEFYWNTVPRVTYHKDLEDTYNQIVFWRKNIFMVITEAAGKKFIDEIFRFLNLWTNDAPLNNITLKAIHVMSALLKRTQNTS